MTTIKVRRGTATQWANAATVLAAGEPGLDTTNNVLKLGDGSTAWASLPVSNSGTYARLLTTDATSTAASGTLAAWHLTPVDATSASATWTLPAASSVTAGVEVAVKKADTTANTVTVSRAGSDLIFGTGSGSTTKTLTLAGEAVTFVSDGVSKWTIQTSDTPSGVLASTYVPQAATGYANGILSARATSKRGSLPRMVPLITGTDDETGILSNCSAVADTTNFKVGDRGWQITSTASGFMTFALDPIPPVVTTTAGIPLPPWQALSAWIYIPDTTKVVDITLYVYFDDALTTPNRWGKGSSVFPTQTFVNGWNLIRIPANYSTLPTDTTTAYRVAVVVNTNASSTVVTIGQVWLESHAKAKVMLVLDRGYQSFFDYAYPLLKAAGIPVTVAADTTLFGTTGVISEAYLDTLAAENGNSVSLHGYDGSTTSGMTAAQLRADQAKGMKWLSRKGFAGRMWRAAFVQQNAPQYAAVRGMVVGSASGVTADADKWNVWPPQDLMRISRRALDNTGGYTTGTTDTAFAFLQAHYGLDVYFMHGIGTVNTFDTPTTLFDYWLAKVQAGIAAGWLEAVTFEELYYRAGGQFQHLGGASMATYTDATGTVVNKTIV